MLTPFLILFSYFSLAGHPDGHPERVVNEDTEIIRLKEKVDAGADFIITQLFYDAEQFLSWYKKLREKGLVFLRLAIQ